MTSEGWVTEAVQSGVGLSTRTGRSGPLRAGVFGGTFDPVHLGHLILLAEAHAELALDVVILMPAADPPHKQGRYISSVDDRIRMCRLATIDAVALRVSRIDVDRAGPHYSADMVGLLQAELGQAAEVYFLMGTDSLRDLPTWHEPERLMHQCTLVAMSRAGVEIDWPALESELPGIQERVLLVDMPEIEISGTDIRTRVNEGRSIRYHVPRMVENYIYARELYRDR